jgi:DnaJ-class molecular chaperone
LCLLATSQIVAPGDMLTVPGEGLVGGDLVIYFEIQFPKTLTPAQKKTIKGVGM